jgi:hypothetical protein
LYQISPHYNAKTKKSRRGFASGIFFGINKWKRKSQRCVVQRGGGCPSLSKRCPSVWQGLPFLLFPPLPYFVFDGSKENPLKK